MRNIIYLVTEEFLSIDNIKIILTKHFEAKKYQYLFKNLSVEQIAINKYEVTGVFCNQIKKIFLYIAKGSGSFVDVLVYEKTDDTNLNKQDPDSFWEITKNAPKESGNMTSQRLAKVSSVHQQYGNKIPFYYLIDYHTKLTDNDVNTTADREFGKFEAMGATVLFTYKGSITTHKYNSKQVIKVLQDLKHSGKTNKISIDSKGNVVLETNLFKNKKTKTGIHDPNVGWFCGGCYLANKFGASSVTLNSNKDLSKLTGSNKLIKTLNYYNVKVKYQGKLICIPKSENSIDYWSMEESGEKLTTISLHQEVLNQGKDIIFSNHAGCEKSFLKLPNGKQKQIKGNVRGLPDLVYADHKNKILFVIEGEREVNYAQGLKQVKSKSFKKWIYQQLSDYKGYTVKVYIATNGTKNDKEKHNLYSTAKNNLKAFNNKAKPVYTIQL